jgi:hypothetical protein
MSGPHVIDWLTFLIVVATGVIVPTGQWAWNKFWVKPHLFTLQLDKGWKQTEVVRFKPGKTSLELIIHLRQPTAIDRINLRFVRTSSGENIDPAIISITEFSHAETAFISPATRVEPDTRGGIQVIYDPPMRRSQHDDLRVTIGITAANTFWNGYLSLRGYDNDGDPTFARFPCSIEPTGG